MKPKEFTRACNCVGSKKAMVCWSSTALGCRYGLIEFLRSLKTIDGK